MPKALRAPGAPAACRSAEDVSYGLATRAALAARVGVPTPVMDAIVTLASAVLGTDCRAEARKLAELGLAGVGPEAVRAAAERGWGEDRGGGSPAP